MLRNGHSIECCYICLFLSFPFCLFPLHCVFFNSFYWQFVITLYWFFLSHFSIIIPLSVMHLSFYPILHSAWNHFVLLFIWRLCCDEPKNYMPPNKKEEAAKTPANKWIERYLIVCETEANGNNTEWRRGKTMWFWAVIFSLLVCFLK